VDAREAVALVEGLKSMMNEKWSEVEKQRRTDEETRTEFDKRMTDIQKVVDEVRRQTVPGQQTNLSGVEQKVYGATRTGLFRGQMTIPYAPPLDTDGKRTGGISAMTLSPTSPIVRDRDREQLAEIQNLNDAVVMRYWMLKKQNPTWDPQQIRDAIAKTGDFKDYAYALHRAGYCDLTRANEIIHPGTSGIGVKLDFTLLSAQLSDRMKIQPGLMNRFPVFPMVRKRVDVPTQTGDSMGILGGGATQPPPTTNASGTSTGPGFYVVPASQYWTNPTFNSVSLVAIHTLGFIVWNDDMFEDSIIPFVPLMREQAALMIVRATDTALINGDLTGTHMDSDVTNAWDARKSWDGLRNLAQTNMKTHSGAALTLAGLRTLRASTGLYGMDPRAAFFLVHVGGFYELLKDANVSQASQWGDASASIRTGTITKIDGVDWSSPSSCARISTRRVCTTPRPRPAPSRPTAGRIASGTVSMDRCSWKRRASRRHSTPSCRPTCDRTSSRATATS